MSSGSAESRLRVAELAAEFIARHASQNKTGAETARIFNREILPYWGSWAVGEVSVIALLDRVRERGSPIMANRVLASVRKFFNWCIGRGILEVSPCTGMEARPDQEARSIPLATIGRYENATDRGRGASPAIQVVD
jgi:hypothetical protein